MRLQILYFESLSENSGKSPLKQRNANVPESSHSLKTPLRPRLQNIAPPVKQCAKVNSPRLNSPISFKIPNTPARAQTRNPAGVKVQQSVAPSASAGQDSLSEAYAEKRRQVDFYEKQLELAKFELLEISVQIEDSIRQQHIEQARKNGSSDTKVYQQASRIATEKMRSLDMAVSVHKQGQSSLESMFPAITTFTQKASSIFGNNDATSRKLKPVPDAHTEEEGQSFKFDPSSILDPLKERASEIFNPLHDNKEIQTFISNSNQHIGRISHKTSQFFNLVMENMTPRATRHRSSLDVDGDTSINDCSWLNLPQPSGHDSHALDHSLVLSDGEVDIDDCDSTF